MDFRIQQGTQGIEVFLTGKLTMRDHDEFQRMLDAVGAAGGDRVIIDLSGIDFVDSAGLGLLLVAREQARSRNRGIGLRRPQRHVLQLLELGDFRRVMPIEA